MTTVTILIPSLSIPTMLCSISAGKSGSNWLDRLRSSRGFPADHDLNLEQFLNHQNPYFSNSSSDSIFADSAATNNDPNSNNNLTLAENLVLDRKKTTEIRPENGERKWFGKMSSVLSELFIMGESNDYRRKKNSRNYYALRFVLLQLPQTTNIYSDGNCSVTVE